MAIRSGILNTKQLATASANTKLTSNGITSANNINNCHKIFKGKPTL